LAVADAKSGEGRDGREQASQPPCVTETVDAASRESGRAENEDERGDSEDGADLSGHLDEPHPVAARRCSTSTVAAL
jgi:hypothetical protein